MAVNLAKGVNERTREGRKSDLCESSSFDSSVDAVMDDGGVFQKAKPLPVLH